MSARDTDVGGHDYSQDGSMKQAARRPNARSNAAAHACVVSALFGEMAEDALRASQCHKVLIAYRRADIRIRGCRRCRRRDRALAGGGRGEDAATPRGRP